MQRQNPLERSWFSTVLIGESDRRVQFQNKLELGLELPSKAEALVSFRWQLKLPLEDRQRSGAY